MAEFITSRKVQRGIMWFHLIMGALAVWDIKSEPIGRLTALVMVYIVYVLIRDADNE